MSIYGYTRLNNHRPTPDKLDTRNQARMIRKWSEKKELKLKKIFTTTKRGISQKMKIKINFSYQAFHLP